MAKKKIRDIHLPERRGDEIGRAARVEPRGIETTEKQVPQEWREVVQYREVLQHMMDQIERDVDRKRRWRARFNTLLTGVDILYPRFKPLTKLMRFSMPRDKAARFYERFRKAEGVKKWVFGAGALIALGLSVIDVSWSVIALSVLVGAEAAIAHYEQKAAD